MRGRDQHAGHPPALGHRPALGRGARVGGDLVFDLPAVASRVLDHPGAALFLRPKPGVQSLRDPLIQTTLRCSAKGSARANDMVLQAGSVLALPFVTLPLVSVMCMLGKPRGHGTIEFTSPSPRAGPRIDSRLLEDPTDRDRVLAALAPVCFRAVADEGHAR